MLNIKARDFESRYWAGDDHHWSAPLWPFNDTGYVSDETLSVKSFDEGETPDTRIKILNREKDALVIVDGPTGSLSRDGSPVSADCSPGR